MSKCTPDAVLIPNQIDNMSNDNTSCISELKQHYHYKNLTDVLLSPGVTVYRINDNKVYSWIIEHIELYKDEVVYVDDSDNYFNNHDIGITVFLSEKDAESHICDTCSTSDDQSLLRENLKFIENFKCSSFNIEQDKCKNCLAKYQSDYLVSQGVLYPKLKIGQTVYVIKSSSCENIDGNYNCCQYYTFSEDNSICNREYNSECPYQFYVETRTVTKYNIFALSDSLERDVFKSSNDAWDRIAELSNK